MTRLKTVFAILILLCFVAAMAITLFIMTLDPNQLKQNMIEEVREKTGYELAVAGELSWSFYPRLALKINHLTVAESKLAQPFAYLQDIKIAIELKDLLHSRETLQGNIRIGNLKFRNIEASNVDTTLHWQKNGFSLQPITASLYDGNMEGMIEGSELWGMPRWHWDMQFSHIQLRPLLQDLYGPNSKVKLSGIGQVKIYATTQGKDKRQILNQLNGASEFSLSHGALLDIDINYYVQVAQALINKESIETFQQSNQTIFNQLSGAAIIKNGIANSNNLLLISPAFVTRGEGSIALLSQDLDLEFKIEQQNAKIPWKIPLLVTGNMSSPSIQIDTSEIQKILFNREVNKIKEKARDQIKNHISEKANEFLQKLLGD